MINNNWLLGFIEAEGTISYNKRLKKPEFIITQHIADYKLMEKIFWEERSSSQNQFFGKARFSKKYWRRLCRRHDCAHVVGSTIFFDSKKIIWGSLRDPKIRAHLKIGCAGLAGASPPKRGALVKFSNRDLTCDVAETNIKNLKENIIPILINKLYSEKRVNQRAPAPTAPVPPRLNEHWKELLPLNPGQTIPNTDKRPVGWVSGNGRRGRIVFYNNGAGGAPIIK
jgi:hypothetical protein